MSTTLPAKPARAEGPPRSPHDEFARYASRLFPGTALTPEVVRKAVSAWGAEETRRRLSEAIRSENPDMPEGSENFYARELVDLALMPDEPYVTPAPMDELRQTCGDYRRELAEALDRAGSLIRRGEATAAAAIDAWWAEAQEIEARHARAYEAIAERAANAHPVPPPGAGLRIVLQEMARAMPSTRRTSRRPFLTLSRPTRTARRTTARRGASFGTPTRAALSDDGGGGEGEADPPRRASPSLRGRVDERAAAHPRAA